MAKVSSKESQCWSILRQVFPTSSHQAFAKNFPQGERNRERKTERRDRIIEKNILRKTEEVKNIRCREQQKRDHKLYFGCE